MNKTQVNWLTPVHLEKSITTKEEMRTLKTKLNSYIGGVGFTNE